MKKLIYKIYCSWLQNQNDSKDKIYFVAKCAKRMRHILVNLQATDAWSRPVEAGWNAALIWPISLQSKFNLYYQKEPWLIF